MLEHFRRTKKVTQVGVLVHDLAPSTLSYGLIDLGNKLADRLDVDFYVFVADWKTPPHTHKFPIYQYRNMWGFEGTLISTSLKTNAYLSNIPDTCRKLFYMWKIDEFQSVGNLNELGKIFTVDTEVICRSEEYADLVSINLNVSPKVAPSFDSPEFLNIIGIKD